MTDPTLRAFALPDHVQELPPAQGYLRPLVGPLGGIVSAITLEPAIELDLANDLPDGDARAEALAVRLRRSGVELAWGEPLAPSSATEAERFVYRRGRSSVEIARADPSLVSELQIGSWFNTGWRGRLLRRMLIRIPRLSTLLRLLVRRPATLKLSLDVWFWTGVRSRASSTEWQRLTRSSYVALCYHQLSAELLDLKPELNVPWRRFRRQVRMLKRLGYRPMGLEETIIFHQDPTAVLGGRRYLLTADDGYLGAVESLERYAADTRPVSFIVTRFAMGETTWDVQPAFADWSRVRKANNAGVVLGAHSRRHPVLVDCDDAALEDELAGARADFEAAGLPAPPIVAYPYGRHDHRVRNAAAGSYALAYTTRAGRNAAGTDPWCLRRITVEPWDGPLAFLWKLITGEALPTFVERLRRRVLRRTVAPQRTG